MNENIHKVLEILEHWKNRFPNIEYVSFTLNDKTLRIDVRWYPMGEMQANYSRSIPLSDLKSYYQFNALENLLFDEIDSFQREWGKE